jgi:GTPase SAR1 family protein
MLAQKDSRDLAQLFVLDRAAGRIVSFVSGLVLQLEWRNYLAWAADRGRIGQGVHLDDKRKQYWVYQSDGLIINDRLTWDDQYDRSKPVVLMNPLVFDITGASYEAGTLIQARPPHSGGNQRWVLQEPSIIFTPQEELIPLPVKKYLVPGLSVAFPFPVVCIHPVSMPELCLQVYNRNKHVESPDTAFLRLGARRLNHSQLFWFDEEHTVFISRVSGLALRFECGRRSGARIIPWASYDTERERWRRDGPVIFMGGTKLCLTICDKAEAGSNVNLGVYQNSPLQKWVIEDREPRAGSEPVWEVPVIYRRMLRDRHTAIRLLGNIAIREEERVSIIEQIALCDCALMSAFVYDYAENPARRIEDWFVSSDPGICAAWNLDPKLLQELEVLLNPRNGMRGELFFPTRRVDGCSARPILAFKGTGGLVTRADGTVEGSARADMIENARHAFGATSEYMQLAELIAQKLLELPPQFEFLLTGHSLGGRIAAAISRLTGKRAITFNAAGLNERLLSRTLPTSHILNCVIAGEILTTVQEEIQHMKRTREVETVIQHLRDIVQLATSAGEHFWESWRRFETIDEYRVFLFLVSQLEDEELPIAAAARDREIRLHPKLDMDDDQFVAIETGAYTLGGVVHLVGCIARLIRDVQLFTLPDYREMLFNTPRARLPLRDWLHRVLEGKDKVLQACGSVDWNALGSCGRAWKLHSTDVICPSIRSEFRDHVQKMRNVLRQRNPDRPPATMYIVGARGTGKTTIWARLAQKDSQEQRATVGAGVADVQHVMADGFQVSLTLWDTYPTGIHLLGPILAKAAVIVMVIDGSRSDTHLYLNELQFLVESQPGKSGSRLNTDTRFVIAVSKLDLPRKAEARHIQEVAQRLSSHGGISIFDISALNGGDEFSAFANFLMNAVRDYDDLRTFSA